MLTYSFSDLNGQSYYEYLYNCIREDIITGKLKTGEKLPSKRSFAAHLNISTITIENAYAQLLAEGYLYSVPKKGYYVADIDILSVKRSAPELPKAATETQNDFDHPLLQSKKQFFADFTSGRTNPDHFPFSIWARLMREVISEKSHELMTNPPCGGILELREAICHYLLDFRGIVAAPEQIIIGAGTEYLTLLLIQLFGRDRIYGVEEPGYRKIVRIYEQTGVPFVSLPLDKNGISLKALEKETVDILHISPSHHFPTGIATPIGRRFALLNWAGQSPDRYILEDDYDSEFRMSGKPLPTLKSIDRDERVIYINTFTKTLASTIRISYMVLPPHLAKRFYDTLGFYSSTVSNFEQLTLAHFIRDGYFEKHINRMRTYYRNLRNRFLAALNNSPFASSITISNEDAGLHFLMQVNTRHTPETLLTRAEAAGLKLSFLHDYYRFPPKEAKPVFLINYSAIRPEEISEIVDRFARILAD